MLAIIGIVIISSLFVLDAVTSEEVREMLLNVVLVLGIVALGGSIISLLAKPRA